MAVDFSEQIAHFLSADEGEEVRGDLVTIARTLEDAINSQLNTVTNDMTDTDPNAAPQAHIVGEMIDRLGDSENDWMLTDFEKNPKWYLSSGSLGSNTSLYHSQFIPVYPNQVLYGVWWAGNYPQQACGGAIFDREKNWIAPIMFPFERDGVLEPGSDFVEEYYYDNANVKSGTADIVFTKMYKITIPEDGWYVVLNRATADTSDTQCLSTLPMIGATDTGNRIWRKDDPKRAIKKGKKLYIIGPSSLAIDRGYRRIYKANDNPPEQATDLPLRIICGFQEYLLPYYDKVISLGFSGKSQIEIYDEIKNNSYRSGEHDVNTLADADEVIIMSNSNGAGNANLIGSATDDDENPTTYCGAINKLIDLIYEKNSGVNAGNRHAVRIYLSTSCVRVGKDKGAYEMYLLRNEKIREIAKRRNLGLIEEAYSGINGDNYAYYSYDSWINTTQQPYAPYGMHMNNAGNRIRGNIYLQALLNDGADSVVSDEEKNVSRLEQDMYFSDEIISGDFLKPEWIPHSYVSNVDGSVNYTSQNYSVTKNLTRVPETGVLAIHFYAATTHTTRIVTYNEDGSFKGYNDYIAPGDLRFGTDDAAFVRIQYAAIETAQYKINSSIFIRVDYENGDIAHHDSVDQKVSDDVYETVTGAGNQIVLKNTSHDRFKSIGVTNPTQDTVLTVCGKNLFNIRDYANILENFEGGACNIERNNVKFVFIPSKGIIRILNKLVNNVPQPASNGTSSVSGDLGNNYRYISRDEGSWTIETEFYHNFKFRFHTDTFVSISDNSFNYVTGEAIHLPFNAGVQMRITDDGERSYKVINGGLSFLAKANTDYAVYFVVQKGFLGDIAFKPQIEIGSHPTAYESFAGYKLSGLNSSGADTNLFRLQNSDSSAIRSEDGSLTAIFNSQNNNIYISKKATDNSGSTVIIPSTHGTPPAGELSYIVRFTGDGGYYLISGIPRTKDHAVVAQIYSEVEDAAPVNPVYDVGDGVILLTKSGTVYNYRILVRNDADFTGTIKPVIKKQKSALSIAKSLPGMTTLFTNDGTSISVTAKAMRNSESIANSAKIAERVNILTGGRILEEPEKRHPMISFIDDDTSSLALVQEYHTVCSTAGNGDTPILGGFAVEAQHLLDNSSLKAELLNYEKEGYACLYHCLEQISTDTADNTWYWVDNPNHCDGTKPEGVAAYNETQIRENFVAGLLNMRGFGFINWQYWVTPYGVNNEFMQSLAKQYGMKCLVSFQSRITEFDAYVSRYGNVGKWDIPRFHFAAGTDDDKLKSIIDACAKDNGWLTVTTHANTWPSDTSDRNAVKDRFKAIVRYAQSAGIEVVPFPVGFETFKPYLDMHDLLK